ncbi:MAG: hypothetical protein LBF22_10490 [Deltaproteobacteria bacterium]|nr:hypothetical protein [Deltaproteobacteria bacterium]
MWRAFGAGFYGGYLEWESGVVSGHLWRTIGAGVYGGRLESVILAARF